MSVPRVIACGVLLAAACGGRIDGAASGSDSGSPPFDAGAKLDAGNQGPLDSGSKFDGPSAVAFKQDYVMTCISQVVGGTVDQATNFNATVQYVPSASGATLQFTDQALVIGATSTSQGVGTAVSVDGSPIAPDGSCDVILGNTVVPAAADPLGSDIAFADLALHFPAIAPGSLCATMSGDITAPLQVTLDPSQNICILTPTTTGSISPLLQSQVHCP